MPKHLLASAAILALLTGSAMAADLPVYTEPVAQAYIAPAGFSWTGFYVGVDAGYGIGRSDAEADFDIDDDDPEAEGPLADVAVTVGDWWSGGGLLGLNVGYQYQFGMFVLGAELAAAYTGIDGEDRLTIDVATPGGVFNAEAFLATDVSWLATARLKAGVAIDRGLVYAIGGVAFADVENSIGFDISAGDTDRSDRWANGDWQTGWTLGAGLQYALTDAWILGVEYQHVFLGNQTVDVDGGEDIGTIPVEFDNDLDIVKASISYKF